MPLHIASLGSSFASGPWLKPQIPPKGAGRSANNYAHLLADRIGAKLTDLSVAGATLLNLLNEPQTSEALLGKATFKPQVEDLPADPDVVLVLGGGNDLGYAGAIFADSFQSSIIVRLFMPVLDWLLGLSETSALSEEDLAERYGTVLDAVHAKAPKAKVIVVEYATLLGSDAKLGPYIPFGAAKIQHHQEVAATLQRATAKAVLDRQQWCERLPVAEASSAHGAGSKDPWVVGFQFSMFIWGPCPWHLNEEGMRAVADMLYEKLKALRMVD